MTDDAPQAEAAAARPPLGASDAPVASETAIDAADIPTEAIGRPPARLRRPRGAARSAGLLAAAATGGALVAFGVRDDGNVFAAFTAAGRLMLGIAPTEGALASTFAFAAGVIVHLGVCLLWGALFAWLAARRRPWHLAVTALLLATAVYSASTLWLPRLLQIGYALHVTKPQLVLLHALLAGGLWAGTRLAQLGPRDA